VKKQSVSSSGVMSFQECPCKKMWEEERKEV
jgi:hypothetical protein